MDIRSNVIQAVIEAIQERVDDDTANLVQDVLTMQLNAYEVTERCTEVAVRDDSAQGLLKKFLATKRVEGIADSTLQRYAEINGALLQYLGKPLEEITTYDIRFYLSMRRCYSSFFSWLAAEGLIPHNPCAALAQIKSRKDASEALFVGKGKRLKKSGIEAIIKKLGMTAGVGNAHPHRYRRTLATNLLDRGMNIQDVAAILGHADLKTTQVYCYISLANVKAAYCKFVA